MCDPSPSVVVIIVTPHAHALSTHASKAQIGPLSTHVHTSSGPPPESLLWVDKHKPKSSAELVGVTWGYSGLLGVT